MLLRGLDILNRGKIKFLTYFNRKTLVEYIIWSGYYGNKYVI